MQVDINEALDMTIDFLCFLETGVSAELYGLSSEIFVLFFSSSRPICPAEYRYLTLRRSPCYIFSRQILLES